MKQNKNKTSKTSTAQPGRQAAKRVAAPGLIPPDPAARLYNVVVEIDAFATRNLFFRPLPIRRFSLGLQNGKTTLEATVTLAELCVVGDWVYIMGPHVTLRSPDVLEELAERYIPLDTDSVEQCFPA